MMSARAVIACLQFIVSVFACVLIGSELGWRVGAGVYLLVWAFAPVEPS